MIEIPIEVLYPDEEVTMNSFLLPGKPTNGDKWKLTPHQFNLLSTIVQAAEDEEHGFYLLPKDLEFFKRIINDSEFYQSDRLWLQCGVIHYYNHRHSDRDIRFEYPFEIYENLYYGNK